MILLVDDTPENLFSLKKVLEINNFAVDTANSGEEALKKILKNSYALIILDVQMPGMDGFEVAEAISGYSKTKDTPILFLSAISTHKKYILKGYASGGFDYVTKPVDVDILLLKVKTLYRLYEQTLELRTIQNSLREEIEYRKKAEQKKDEFISIASHELKTPLTSIKGYVQLVERSVKQYNDANVNKFINRTHIQLGKLQNLIADLLDISKIESGKLEFNYAEFDLTTALQNAIEVVQHTQDCIISLDNTVTTPITGDELRLEQVIINYLTNAIKYSPDDKHITIHARIQPDGLLYLGVKDAGIGIPKEKQEKVFQKFYRIEESSSRFQGLGIGLYICAEIIRRHNGNVGVVSEPGRGSEFFFTIPVRPDDAPPDRQIFAGKLANPAIIHTFTV